MLCWNSLMKYDLDSLISSSSDRYIYFKVLNLLTIFNLLMFIWFITFCWRIANSFEEDFDELQNHCSNPDNKLKAPNFQIPEYSCLKYVVWLLYIFYLHTIFIYFWKGQNPLSVLSHIFYINNKFSIYIYCMYK